MRSMIFAALVAATTISFASAEDVSTPSPPPTPGTADKTPGISPQQEAAIPYIPCTIAVGWVNGRLRCNNRY
jgi:hypothetical protein